MQQATGNFSYWSLSEKQKRSEATEQEEFEAVEDVQVKIDSISRSGKVTFAFNQELILPTDQQLAALGAKRALASVRDIDLSKVVDIRIQSEDAGSVQIRPAIEEW